MKSQQQLNGETTENMANHSYNDLIGAIDQGTSSTRFLVFEKGNGQLVASSQLEVKRITPREGWVEMEPNSIMASVHATMANVHEQLLVKLNQNNTDDNTTSQNLLNGPMLKCIGICNQRESAVVWDSKTGQPLYNVIVWMDNRTKDLVDDMIDSFPGRDFNHLKYKTGLPMSTYFSAFKLRWLIDNVPAVGDALREKRLLVGTVDSWILWNLTGKHLTDVTNASRTFLMDIETLQWDKSLCKQFKVPMEILPKILSSADDFGQLQFGPFMGTPVTGVIGDQSAALFGHNCLQLGQTKATFGTGCFIMQNIGPGPLNGALAGVQREAKRGLITTVGYKLKDKPASYALEGSIKIAGAALTWLRDNMQLIQNYEECDQLVNQTTDSAGVFFVPALGGLYSPYWDPNASGLFIGLSQFTRREHLVRATFDAVAFQTNDILSLMHGVTSGLMIDGGLCKSENLCQILADITGCEIVRPSMCETSALGAAMVAGCGAGIWDYESMLANSNTPHEYTCSSNQTHHYPHESLHSSGGGHKLSHQAKITDTTPNDHHKPQSQVANKQVRRSLRHRNNSGHLMRQLDAGGGINDDAGGGERPRLGRRSPSTGSRSDTLTSDDEEDNASSGVHVVGSDLELGVSSSSGEFAPVGVAAAQVIDNNSKATISQESNQLAGPARTLATNLVNQQHVTEPSSSGYSSGDNLEQATGGGGGGARADSPSASSQATDAPPLTLSSGRESVAACADELISEVAIGSNHQCDSNAIVGNNQQQQQVALVATTNQQVNKSSVARHAQENNNRKFVAKAEVVADEVNEFGGRDSYGEDGYDSSTVSFDSYDDQVVDDDDDDVDNNINTKNGCDISQTKTEINENQNNELLLAGEGQDNVINETNVQQHHQDSLHHNHHHHHHHHHNYHHLNHHSNHNHSNNHQHRRRQPSLVEKQMDVFQSYISLEHRTQLVDTWRAAVSRSMQWTKVHHEEIRRIDYQRLSSLPISMYIFFSIGLVALSGLMSPGRF